MDVIGAELAGADRYIQYPHCPTLSGLLNQKNQNDGSDSAVYDRHKAVGYSCPGFILCDAVHSQNHLPAQRRS